MSKPMNVLFLAAEAAPLVKVGGLADVAGALPAELRRLGADARLTLPLHPNLRAMIRDLRPAVRPMVPACGTVLPAEVYQTELDGVPVYLIDGEPLQQADAIYHSDPLRDAEKFLFFTLASLELARSLRWKPDIVHANDWHTAAACLWLALHREKDRHFANARSVLSIHNLPYMGEHAGSALALYGLEIPTWAGAGINRPPRLPALQAGTPLQLRLASLPAWAQSALLPLGLAAADLILTVSPSYAAEMLTPEFGAGLDPFLRTRADRVAGILNGLDTLTWDPARDERLAENFDSSSWERRSRNREAVAEAGGLAADPGAALIGIVSRLTGQKGIDLALPALDLWCNRGHQAVILGTGDPDLEREVRAFAARHPGRAAAVIGYDDALAARMYGGADYLLIPSRYEPCGLTQMIAMRYGAIPIARAVGGLRDTVRDVDSPDGNGFLFEEASTTAAALALGRAAEFHRQADRRRAAQARGMTADFSWKVSAAAYLDAYRKLLSA
jgi:starch synthase